MIFLLKSITIFRVCDTLKYIEDILITRLVKIFNNFQSCLGYIRNVQLLT